MKAECPNPKCRSKEMKTVINYNDGSDSSTCLGHFHLMCQQCGRNFNLWEATQEEIKKAFGHNWKLYV
jgi:hypothetical protein